MRIHDDEPDTGEPVVRTLLAAECPHWAACPLEYLATSGTDNAMWRVRGGDDPDVVVRLPRRPHAAARVERETTALSQLAASRIAVRTPVVRHVGAPHDVFPHRWSVLDWIDGTDAWTARDELTGRALDRLAEDLGQAVAAIASTTEVDAAPREPGERGGPLEALLAELDEWLDDPVWDAASLIDVAAVRRLADEAREIIDEPVTEGLVHGDLIPGNLLVAGGRLSAIIDWGGIGWGDVAQDLGPAWAVLAGPARSAFRHVVGADDAAWIRGRTFELEHAVGGVLYYVPRRHVLGDVMSRTLARLLE